MAFGIAGYGILLPHLGFSGPIHSRLLNLPGYYFYLHTLGGAVALVLAPFQLTRNSQRVWHKFRGYIYTLSVMISCIGGLYMAQNAYGGLPSVIALNLLAFFWFGTTCAGVWMAIKKKFSAHKRWMIRSIALTLAAITLRLISPILYANFSLYEAQQIIYWTCWPINLLIAEFYIRKLLHN